MRMLIEPDKPKPRAVKQAAEILRRGGIIVYPTDTVYGIGCLISNKRGVEKIQVIKGSNKPRSIMLDDLKSISTYGKVSNEAFRLMRACLPGPYTFILPATREVPRLMQSNRKTVGIRIPDNWFCRDLVTELGEPILTSSIPLDVDRVHIDPLEIEQAFGHVVDAIVDCGILPDIPSTVISFEDEEAVIIREGQGPVDFFAA